MPAAAVISDLSVKSPSRLLAEALRVRLGSSPADHLAGPPAGTLEVERSYLPIFELPSTELTVVSLIPQEQSGQIATRSGSYRTTRTVTVMVSVQRLLTDSPQSLQGTTELDEMKDYSERVLRACIEETVYDPDGRPFAATDFDSTGHDEEVLKEWSQFAEVHSISYDTFA